MGVQYQTAPLLRTLRGFNCVQRHPSAVRSKGGVVAVQGLGGLGHLAVQYAYKMGYEAVAMSSGDDKDEFAKQLRAHHCVNTKTHDAVDLN